MAKQEWGTVGVHDNIIEASLQALVRQPGIPADEEIDRRPALAESASRRQSTFNPRLHFYV